MRQSHHGRRVATGVVLAFAMSGCTGPGEVRNPEEAATQQVAAPLAVPERVEPRASPLETNVDSLTLFVLGEDDRSVVVLPHTVVGPDGGLLMADRAEHQVRYYAPDGSLEWRFGRKGRGPTDLSDPVGAVWLPDSTVYVVSYYTHDGLWAQRGEQVLYTVPRRGAQLPLGVTVVGDSLIAVANRARFRQDTTLQDPLVELVRSRDGANIGRLFLPDVVGLTGYAVGMDGFATVAARGDTLAAAFSLGNEVFLFTPDGREVGRVPIPFVRYRRVELPAEEYLTRSQNLTADYTGINGLYWLSDGSFLVEFRDRSEGPGDASWHLLRMTRDGQFVFESPVARVRAVDTEALRVYVQDPDYLEPNRWLVGKLLSLHE